MYKFHDKWFKWSWINSWQFGKKIAIQLKENITELIYNKKYLKSKTNQHRKKLSILLYTNKIIWFNL